MFSRRFVSLRHQVVLHHGNADLRCVCLSLLAFHHTLQEKILPGTHEKIEQARSRNGLDELGDDVLFVLVRHEKRVGRL